MGKPFRGMAGANLFASRLAGFGEEFVARLHRGESGHGARDERQNDKAKKDAAEKFGISRNSRIHVKSPKTCIPIGNPAADSTLPPGRVFNVKTTLRKP